MVEFLWGRETTRILDSYVGFQERKLGFDILLMHWTSSQGCPSSPRCLALRSLSGDAYEKEDSGQKRSAEHTWLKEPMSFVRKRQSRQSSSIHTLQTLRKARGSHKHPFFASQSSWWLSMPLSYTTPWNWNSQPTIAKLVRRRRRALIIRNRSRWVHEEDMTFGRTLQTVKGSVLLRYKRYSWKRPCLPRQPIIRYPFRWFQRTVAMESSWEGSLSCPSLGTIDLCIGRWPLQERRFCIQMDFVCASWKFVSW